jgi:hypothetical protein
MNSEFEDNMFCEDKSVDTFNGQTSETSIDDLPYVVFEYILSHLSPYKELIDCKLVSKSWRSSVIGIQINYFIEIKIIYSYSQR